MYFIILGTGTCVFWDEVCRVYMWAFLWCVGRKNVLVAVCLYLYGKKVKES